MFAVLLRVVAFVFCFCFVTLAFVPGMWGLPEAPPLGAQIFLTVMGAVVGIAGVLSLLDIDLN